MNEINFQEMAKVIMEWENLPAPEVGSRLSRVPKEQKSIADLKNMAYNMAHFMELLRKELPPIKETLNTLLLRDYILRTQSMCVYIMPFHYMGQREVLEKADIPSTEPITSLEALSALIFQILSRTTLNVQMVWSEYKRTGTLFVDDKNFKQR